MIVIVNQFFLPMIKQKIENPKEEIEVELKKKKERIRKAYVNEVFILEEKLSESEICDELKFTPEDILIKRDIDFINLIKYPEELKEYNRR